METLKQMLDRINLSSKELRKENIEACKDIEMRLLRLCRGNPELTAEILDARAIRESKFSK